MTAEIDYYKQLIHRRGTTITVGLDQEKCAAILKAHDYGIRSLNNSDVDILDRAITELALEIRP